MVERQKKQYSRSWHKKNADNWFSKYIRLRDKKCYTCNTTSTKLQCGHFVPRQYLATRYDERNNHAQCFACNMFYAGQPATYAKNLIRDFGPGIVEELESKRYEINRYLDFEKIASDYKAKYESLLKEKNMVQ